jgi:hypothetical protein
MILTFIAGLIRFSITPLKTFPRFHSCFKLFHNRKSLVKDENDGEGVGGGEEEVEAPRLAENCMRDLVNKATFGHVRSIIRPVLQ